MAVITRPVAPQEAPEADQEPPRPRRRRWLRRVVWAKWEGHEINSARFVKPDRTMHAIGG